MKAVLLKKSLLVVTAVLFGATAFAQSGWKTHQTKAHATSAAARPAAEETTGTSTLEVGHSMGYDATIWPGDGYTFEEERRIGAGALITKSMLKYYVGGRIVALNLGWNGCYYDEQWKTHFVDGHYDAFLSESVGGEKVRTGSGDVSYNSTNLGWNLITLNEPYEITEETGDIFAGFYVNVPKSVCCIPTLQNQVPNSTYLWDGVSVDGEGKELWEDYSMIDRPLAIHLVIEDPDGRFSYLVTLNSIKVDGIANVGENASAYFSLTNKGTESVSQVEVTTKLGDLTNTETINMSQGIPAGSTVNIVMPVYCFGTGKHSVSITKIEGEESTLVENVDVEMLGIPAGVSKQYTLRPLIEWFVSENSYMVPSYTDEILLPGLNNYGDKMTLVCQHLDDQFMTGDDDDATRMLLDYVNNDSAYVTVPCVMMNRSYYSYNPDRGDKKGPAFNVIYPWAATTFYDEVLKSPTFGAVAAGAKLDDSGERLLVDVCGDVAEGVMPADEPLYCTVYLMEKNVESDSQLFWTKDQEEASYGKYVHPNVIRMPLTPFYGQQLDSNSGHFSFSLETELDETWNKENLSVVAFINRGIASGNFNAQVINSCEVAVGDDLTGIGSVVADETQAAGPMEVYTFDGRRVAAGNLKAGAYLFKTTVNGKPVVKKVLVK